MFESGEFTKYRHGTAIRSVLLDAPHAARPKADLATGPIVEQAASAVDCHAVVGLVSRTVADLNRRPIDASRQAVAEYRRRLSQAVMASGYAGAGHLERPFLHLSIHGMHDRHGYDVELGTRRGRTCSSEVETWVASHFEAWSTALVTTATAPRIVQNLHFIGHQVLEVHRMGDPVDGYGGYGPHHHTVQIEFARHLRDQHQAAIVDLLSTLATKFDQDFSRE